MSDRGVFLPQDVYFFKFLSRVINSFSTGFSFRYKFSEFIVYTYFSLVKIEARVFKRQSVEELINACLRQTGLDLRFRNTWCVFFFFLLHWCQFGSSSQIVISRILMENNFHLGKRIRSAEISCRLGFRNRET